MQVSCCHNLCKVEYTTMEKLAVHLFIEIHVHAKELIKNNVKCK
jgi:hypothetical protein